MRKNALCAALFALVFTTGCRSTEPAHKAYNQPKELLLNSQWQAEILSQGHSRIDNIVVLPDETVYATLELGQRQGQLIAIVGHRTFVLKTGLNRPDGLAYDKTSQTLYLTEEITKGRVLAYQLRSGNTQTLAKLSSPEGIALIAKNQLVVSEDKANGRVLLFSPQGLRTLAKNLNRPEGLCFDHASQTLYVAETATGRILALKKDKKTLIVDGLQQPDQLECDKDGGLWITEDKKSGRLLRYFNGTLHVIASKLKEPQGISLGENGQIYVAEQGRHRILKLTKY